MIPVPFVEHSLQDTGHNFRVCLFGPKQNLICFF